jgi:SP family arabinose:H+ symporter-like MFS transporter
MLGVELIPAVLYFVSLFFVPKSPRWLFANDQKEEAKVVLNAIHGAETAKEEIESIANNIKLEQNKEKVALKDLLKPSLRFIMIVGLVIGVLQQITGINAVYFYATSIFKQTGIGTDAAFSSGVLLSSITVIFTFVAIFLIDKMGRRPLLLVGISGIAISLLLCSYGFNQATYKLTDAKIESLENLERHLLLPYMDKDYDSDIAFKNDMKTALGTKQYAKNEGAILEVATTINATLVLLGILGFIACFAFSLGPVMWVLLSELFPMKYRGLAIGVIGFINSFISWVVQQVFPWELSNLGNALTFLIFGAIAAIGFFALLRILPETKGKSLEQIEMELVKE